MEAESLSSLPFPEWSDSSLNTEVWEPPKEKGSRGKDPLPVDIVRFEDEQHVLLPPSIVSSVSDWKRPSEIFTTEKILVYEDSSVYSNLADGSKHLLHSEFVRHFVSSVGIMEYLGSNKTLSIEGVGPKFVPTTENEPWRPWHHVYSLTKAGKGQKHKPQVNQLGKYVVRLFWMGCWRKITVDDTLPVDEENIILLPSFPRIHSKSTETANPPPQPPPSVESKGKGKNKGKDKAKGGKKQEKSVAKEEPKDVVQIWPFILSKALLKIASLSWTYYQEISDFDMIHCFTGWIAQKIDTRDLTILDKWEICAQFSDHYAWADDVSKSQTGTAKSKSKQSVKGKKKGDSTKSSKKGGTKGGPSFLEEKLNLTPPYYLVGICSDLSSCQVNEVPDMSPCYSHLFYIDQSRDIPLIRPEPRPELEFWKNFRWVAWAIRNGLIPPPDNMDPIKCLKLISTLRMQAKSDVATEEAACIKKSVEIIEGVALEAAKDKNKEKKEDSVKKGSASSKGSEKKSKSSGSSKTKKGKSTQLLLPLPDISIWCDFTKMWMHIDYLHIYFKSSLFESNYAITNISEMEVSVDPKAKILIKTPSVIIHSLKLNEYKNEPLYVFMDSLDFKFILFSLSQPGLIEKVQTPKAVKSLSRSASSYSNEFEKLLNCTSSNRFTSTVAEVVQEEENETILQRSVEMQTREHEIFSLGHFIAEEYNWQTNGTSKVIVFLNSIGTKSILTNFGKGRTCLRLWVDSSDYYVLNVLSDTNLSIGNLELLLDNMTTESHRLMDCCFSVSSSYGQLVQSFGTPDYRDYLKKFYNSLKPDATYKKTTFENIVNTFLENVLSYLQRNLNPNEYNKCATSLRALFLNTKIGYFGESNTESVDEASIQPSLRECTRAASTIEAFFKKVYVQILKRRHNPLDKEYLNTFDFLKKIYTMCFSVEKRPDICLGLIRALLKDTNFRRCYSWANDLNSVINIQSFNGSASVTFAKWMPICRYLFFCQLEHPVIVKICLFGEIEQYLIRVFDNDNGQELPRHTYQYNTNKFKPNAKGYTILCYGWSETTRKQHNWRLVFVTPREHPENLFSIIETQLDVNTLAMGYIPNVYQKIFSCNLNVQQNTIATFRLLTSYENSKLLLKCLKDNKIQAQIYGKGTIILPSILLECDSATTEDDLRLMSRSSILKRKRSSSKSGLSLDGRKYRDSKSDRTSASSKTDSKMDALSKRGSKDTKSMKKETTYVVEGFVLDSSWPLVEEEWELVKSLKQKRLLGPPGTSMHRISFVESNSSRNPERRSSDKQSITLEKPFWCLQTVFNKGDYVSVRKDGTREDEIRIIKKTWYAGQPERYEKSQSIRNAYLTEIWGELYDNIYKNGTGPSETSLMGDKTCKPPDVLLKIKLAERLLNEYSIVILSENEMLDRDLQTLEQDRRDLQYRQQKIEEFSAYQDKFQRDMTYYLLNQVERCTVLKHFIENCRSESASTVEMIQEKRKQYVESLNPPPDTKGKGKGKKKK